jgi:hypothetical protein
MWPRTDEQRRAMRNCGFVAYMVRSAESVAVLSFWLNVLNLENAAHIEA